MDAAKQTLEVADTILGWCFLLDDDKPLPYKEWWFVIQSIEKMVVIGLPGYFCTHKNGKSTLTIANRKKRT